MSSCATPPVSRGWADGIVTDPPRFDVVIVGAGISGSALAAALSGQGLSIALLEASRPDVGELPQAMGLADFDTRVSALTPRSRALLEQLGAWQSLADYRLCPYGHMTVWDGEGTGRIDFDAAEVGAGALGYIVENRALVRALLDCVAGAPDVQLHCPATLESCAHLPDGAIQLQLAGGEVLEAKLLVAADGALSRVRELAGFATREWDYGHRAVVATVAVARHHEHTARQVFLPGGPVALLPLPGDGERHYCSLVWSLQEDLAAALLAMGDAGFCAELARVTEHCLGAVLACSPRIAFPLRQRHAVDYVQPGVALVADAAHTIHPLAGQGINLGLQDVRVLAEEILAGRRRGVPPGQLALLRRYQRRRKGDNLLMMAAMDGFKRLFEQRSPALRLLRNTGMRTVDRLAPLKRRIIRYAMGVG